MKFCFELTNLKALDAVQIERIQVDTEYTVAEFIAMTAAYPTVVEAFTKLMNPAPSDVVPLRSVAGGL